MKQVIVIICLGIALAACNNTSTTTAGTDSTGAATVKQKAT